MVSYNTCLKKFVTVRVAGLKLVKLQASSPLVVLSNERRPTILEFLLSDHEPLRSSKNKIEREGNLKKKKKKNNCPRAYLCSKLDFLHKMIAAAFGNYAISVIEEVVMLRQSHSWGIRRLWSTANYFCSSHSNLTPVPYCYYKSLYRVEIYVFPLLWKMMKLAVLGMLKSSFRWAVWFAKINPLLWKMFISL